MCEIFAINAEQPLCANAYLRDFFADSVEHPHGWGLAWRRNTELIFYKEPVTAVESSYLDYLLSDEIKSSVLLAHIRNATRGIVSYANCHPFMLADTRGINWVFAHNGTLLEDTLVEPFRASSKGTTDSERLALYLLDLINRTSTLDANAQTGSMYAGTSFEQRFSALSEAMGLLSKNNKLNVVFDDGEYTYIHTNTIQPTLYSFEQNDATTGNKVLICSRPFDDSWQEVPRCSLLAYKNGKLIRASKPHEYLFDNELYMQIIADEQACSSLT